MLKIIIDVIMKQSDKVLTSVTKLSRMSYPARKVTRTEVYPSAVDHEKMSSAYMGKFRIGMVWTNITLL